MHVPEILKHPKVFSFLHIPVQAGSDRVLTAMNREYTVAEFRRVADYLLVRSDSLPQNIYIYLTIFGF